MILLPEKAEEVSDDVNSILSLSTDKDTRQTSKLCAVLRLSEMPLSLEEHDAVATPIARYQSTFASCELLHLAKHQIDTGDATPIKQYDQIC